MLNRRDFLKLIFKGAILGNFYQLITPPLAQAIAAGDVKKLPVVMIEAGTCTGDSISLDNIWTPAFSDVLSNLVDWRYDWVMNQVQGDEVYQILQETYEKLPNEYILLIQGAMIQSGRGHYNHIAYEKGKLITGIELIRRLGIKAKYIVAIGSCAAFGGPASGYPNPAQATGVQNILTERRVINVSGCPAHPDWIIGTLLHLALYGEPELDGYGRPKLFYRETIHNQCPRRHYYDQGIFATDIGQKECLYRVGCKGPVTYADCPTRRWNDRFNWPIGCNTPCIGCTEPGFPDLMSPFSLHSPDIPSPGGTKVTTDSVGLGVLGLTSAAIVGHTAASLYKGRIQRNMLNSTVRQKHRLTLKKVKTFHHYRVKKP
ncbi:hydrogenase small subunit [Desulfosporosinus sp. PR]|uniref:hydrogenase small subunit n=1 Tax=Candidatus Desulfosporosinus nitrosoreducens TaxID=3401928 RepID=UPI0027EBF892|nr:hydrogenase small subunit [Desulfosporosinus sp. PR]MDQ7094165.1 hydrogenase small subunit [Desulfosporosinus sp. PR]